MENLTKETVMKTDKVAVFYYPERGWLNIRGKSYANAQLLVFSLIRAKKLPSEFNAIWLSYDKSNDINLIVGIELTMFMVSKPTPKQKLRSLSDIVKSQ